MPPLFLMKFQEVAMDKPSLELAEIFRKHSRKLGALREDQWRVVSNITNCRTHVLGGHKLQCNNCEHSKYAYHSCRNRHCPKCQYLARIKWIEKRTQDVLPCEYFHVVFTIPSELRRLFLRNKKLCYNILFKASSDTLKEVAENPKNLGAQIGFIGILHTWTQNLMDHPHIHYIVPAGGLNKNNKWVKCKQDYLLPIKILSKVFKAKMLELIREYYNENELELTHSLEHLSAPHIFDGFMLDLAKKDWVVYAKKPFAGPSQVINYLGQYTHRIAISNYRIIKLEDGHVFFKVRDKKNPGKSKIAKLKVTEFMRRFLLHVLPKKFVRIRHFGLLANRSRKVKVEIIRRIHGIVEKVEQELKQSWKELINKHIGVDIRACPKCSCGVLEEVQEYPNLLNTS